MTPPRYIPWLLAPAFIAALLGCAATQKPPLHQRAAVAQLAGQRDGALPYRVALAPIAFQLEPIPKKETERYAFQPNPAGLAQTLIAALSLPGATSAPAAALALSADADDDAAYAAAREAGADLLLKTRLTRHETEYAGVDNARFMWSTFISSGPWIPQWWMDDELYALRLELEAEWYSVHSRAQVGTSRLAVRSERLFDEIDKGFTFWGLLLNWPGSVGRRNWEKIGKQLLPPAMDDLQEALAVELHQSLRVAARREDFRARMRKRLALVVGIGNYAQPRLGTVQHALDDAEAVAAWLKAPDGGALLGEHVLLRSDGAATRAGLEAALAELAQLARPEDTVLVYIAAAGSALSDGAPLLLPQDATLDALAASALRLDDLAAALAKVRARRLLVALDVGFGGEGQGRSRGMAAQAVRMAEAATAMLAGRGQGLVICAARPPGGAVEQKEAGHGLLTSYFLEAASGKADRDHDGIVTEAELAAHLSEHIESLSMVAGAPQEVLLVAAGGRAPSDAAWLLLEGSTASPVTTAGQATNSVEERGTRP